MIDVRYERGVFLPVQELWLDPWDAKPFAFVSHAHSDHIAPHSEVILSEATARLMKERLPGKRREHIIPFGQRTTIRDFEVTLLPAGHIFGSAQFFLETKGRSLLYTGDFKLRPGRSAEAAEWKHAETLIMETTYGLSRYQLPPVEEVVEQIISFCRETLDEGAVPVLLGYSLGKAQEILCSLADAGLTPMLHGSVLRMTRIYEDFGQSFCNYERYKANALNGKVLICPPSANRSQMLEKIRRKRVAMISGWAIDPNAIYRYQVDAAFPLSDHADYNDLLRYVELVQPNRVLTLHGFATEFARDLRQRGIEAWALSAPDQLELSLRAVSSPGSQPGASGFAIRPEKEGLAHREKSGPPVGQSQKTPKMRERAESEFHTFACVGNAIASTPAKLQKVQFLSQYLKTLTATQLPLVTVYFTGKAFPQSDPRTLQTGWAVIFRALIGASKLSEPEFRRIASSHGDASKTAFEVLEGRTMSEPFTILQSRDLFKNLHKTRGPIGKTELLQSRFEKLSALESQYLVKILTGDLRIGLREGLVEEAIAAAFDAPLNEVKEANMLLGDIGETARLAGRGELNQAKLSPFRPIKCMLASPETTAEAIWKRFTDAPALNALAINTDRPTISPELSRAGRQENYSALMPAACAPTGPTVYVEDKFDGIRAQLHRTVMRVEIYSRDLRRITDQFPELAEQARSLSSDLILDGEIMAFEHGKKLTFFDLQKRLGRKDEGADLFAIASANVPVVFIVFDLLWFHGQSLLKMPLWRRRELLQDLTVPSQFQVAKGKPAQSAAEIEMAFREARQRGNEGLMIKDPESFYLPGRRGMAWFKLKKELATLDVVVVAAEFGHGKRNHVLSDYTFAVRDETSSQLLPIGKAYSGLTDVEIVELTEHFKRNTIIDRGRYREVKPDIVLEIAFDSIQPSTRHASGLALRFPRIKAIRRDKTVDEIDTLAYARKLSAEHRGEK